MSADSAEPDDSAARVEMAHLMEAKVAPSLTQGREALVTVRAVALAALPTQAMRVVAATRDPAVQAALRTAQQGRFMEQPPCSH
jgi:hypothetical protein